MYGIRSNYGNPHAEGILAYGIVTEHWTLTADIAVPGLLRYIG
ncbi:hypothetical protein [Nostoc punctiforme]|nr:hypothetical protein [Nostoc punctiforme]